MPQLKTVHVIVSGRVQGVGFRAWTKSNARKRSLDGWVRNLEDKTVEAVFSGDEAMVDDMLKACEDGPLASRVKGLTVQPWQGAVEKGFIQRETKFEPAQSMDDAATTPVM